MLRLFAPCARGLDVIVAAEVTALGGLEVRPARGGVHFAAELRAAYRVLLGTRVASRVLVEIAAAPVADAEQLYAAALEIEWGEHLLPGRTFAVSVTQSGNGQRDPAAPPFHTHYAALRIKDALVDQLRQRRGVRPDVDVERPDLSLHAHLEGGRATFYVDLAGESLHRRGYRQEPAAAPLKETLAAGILLLLDYPARAERGEPLFDPMCGSGTLCLEAALIAARTAPGLLRRQWGAAGWAQHAAATFAEVREELAAQVRAPSADIFGADLDAGTLLAASQAGRQLGAAGARLRFNVGALEAAQPPSEQPGLVVTNPPYGERLEAGEDLYRQIGDVLRRRFLGWHAGVLVGNRELERHIGLRASRRTVLMNGPLECRLLEFPLAATAPTGAGPGWRQASEQSKMFADRVAKNLRHLRKWAKRDDVSCFRVYDADLPEYAVAVDLYEDAAQVQEYAPPKTVDPGKAERRLRDVMMRLPEVLGIAADDVHLKLRRRQHRGDQYGRQADAGVEKAVREGQARLLVNLTDYLDTGLYLDERLVRRRVAAAAAGKRLLNLFAYTGAATVQAALAGAAGSLSVDMSNSYLEWMGRNLALNGIDTRRHQRERADVLAWLRAPAPPEFDVVFLGVPTFSNSAKMAEDLDVQRDHVSLLTQAATRLQPGGVILFTTHAQRFRFDVDGVRAAGLAAEDVSPSTLPPDFARNPRIHQCWLIKRV